VVELVDRAAIELAGRDELVAGLEQAVEDQHLCGVAGADRKPRGAAFERGDPLFQHGVGGVADAGVDVAERLKPEQRGGVIDVVEHEGRGLVDRSCARAGGRIGLRAGVDRERGKAWNAFGHERYLERLPWSQIPGSASPRPKTRLPLVYRTIGGRQGKGRRLR
jgi:hypothetical protein